MRPLVTFMVQLQILVLGVGGGMQEKRFPNLRLFEGDEGPPAPRPAADANWILSSFKQENYQFCQGWCEIPG